MAHLTLALLLFAGSAELWHFAALGAVYGTAIAFFNQAARGLVPDTIPGEHLAAAGIAIALARPGEGEDEIGEQRVREHDPHAARRPRDLVDRDDAREADDGVTRRRGRVREPRRRKRG